jgi:hypothetical protein
MFLMHNQDESDGLSETRRLSLSFREVQEYRTHGLVGDSNPCTEAHGHTATHVAPLAAHASVNESVHLIIGSSIPFIGVIIEFG